MDVAEQWRVLLHRQRSVRRPCWKSRFRWRRDTGVLGKNGLQHSEFILRRVVAMFTSFANRGIVVVRCLMRLVATTTAPIGARHKPEVGATMTCRSFISAPTERVRTKNKKQHSKANDAPAHTTSTHPYTAPEIHLRQGCCPREGHCC